MDKFTRSTTGDEVVAHFKDQVEGKTIIITGASVNGLGAETALSLAKGNPARLILLARSANKVDPVIEEIKKINSSITTTFVPVDLDKQASITSAAAKINDQISHLDILINNAGIMAVPYSKNEAGIESHLATNHVGHFILTNALMPKLRATSSSSSSSARIVNLTSDGYRISPFRFNDYNFSDGATYHEWTGYGQSKTANILFTRYLAKHGSGGSGGRGLQSFTVHPGVIMDTSLSAGMADQQALFADLSRVAEENTGAKFVMEEPKTKQQGVATTLTAALDPSLASRSGSLLIDSKVVDIDAQFDYASSDENAEKLWKLSEELMGQRYEL